MYDPQTDSWSSAGNNPASTLRGSATLLPDGKVAVMGGTDATCIDSYSPTSAKIMLYDPASNSWQPDGEMLTARSYHSATLLPDGKVFLTGSCVCTGTRSNDGMAEFYSPIINGSWTAKGALTVPRRDHTATMLPDGKTIVSGGSNSGVYLRSTEIYEPLTEAWTFGGELATARAEHTATLLADGSLLAVGGFDGSSSLASVELYDRTNQVWTATAGLLQGRQGHTATLLDNGELLVIGGFDGPAPLKTAEVYSPATNSWRPFAGLATPRGNHSATLLEDGTILVAGGFDGVNYLDAVELYDPVANKWSTIEPLNRGRAHHAATLAADGSVTISGGHDAAGAIVTLEYFAPDNLDWAEIESAVATAGSGHTATLLPDGSILLAGGTDNGSFSATTGIYSPVTDLHSAAGSLTTPRAGHTATLQNDGSVLLAGGYSSSGALASAEAFILNSSISSNRRPLVATADIQPGQSGLVLTGTDFRGLSEGSSGAAGSSSTAVPLVQFRRLDNGMTSFLQSDPLQFWSRERFVSAPLADLYLPAGYYQATLFASAIAGDSQYVSVAPSVSPVPALGIAPVPLDFGAAASATSRTVTVANNGNADLVLSELSVTGQDAARFALTATGGCSAAIIPGANCQLDLTFTPATSSPAAAFLRILSNDPRSEEYKLPLISSGSLPKATLELLFSGAGTGTVTTTPVPPGTVCTANCSQQFNSGTAVTLTPAGKGSSVFAGWTNCDSVSGNICAVTMSANKSITAAFSNVAITTALLADGYVGTPYSGALAATGGTAPFSWSIISGSLPAGLSLATTGAVTGTPAAAGSRSLTVQVTDAAGGTASGVVSITINTATPAVSTTSPLPNGIIGIAYSQALSASGGRAPYSWTSTAGVFPAGLTLSADGVISGTPTAAVSNRSLTFQVKDANNATATKTLTISVITATTLTITTTALPGGYRGSYDQTLTASGGTPPYSWSISSGALPSGLMLTAASGRISPSVDTAGTSSFTVRVRDSATPTKNSATKTFSLTFTEPAFINYCANPRGTVGLPYNCQISVSGNNPPYTWFIPHESIPPGLSFDTATATFSGIPTVAGTFALTIHLQDANGITYDLPYSIWIELPFQVNTERLSHGYVGSAYEQNLSAGGGTHPYSWSVIGGALPAGLTLISSSANPGLLYGTPTAPATKTIMLRATDSTGKTASRALTIEVYAAPVIDALPLPDGSVGAAYSQAITASGGKTPYTWSVSSGALPAGLSLDAASGVISGTPTTIGSSSFTLRVSDANSRTSTRGVTINVASAIARIQVSTNYLWLGDIITGSSSSTALSVTNVSQSDLAIAALALPSVPFALSSDTCSNSTLSPGASCTITVQFSPVHGGNSTATFNILSNDEYYPDVPVTLHGYGVFPYFVPDSGANETVRNPLRFTANSSLTIHDDNTGLNWQQQGSSAPMTWAGADSYCKSLTLDGLSGWRLPNSFELASIVHYGATNPAIDTTKFSAITPDNYWTGTTGTGLVNGNPDPNARVVNFASGEAATLSQTGTASVLCTQGEELTGKLSDATSGAETTWTDLNNGLVWMAIGLSTFGEYCIGSDCRPFAWDDAQALCSSVLYAEQGDWRAPTIKELATLATVTSWSITPSVDNPANAWLYSYGVISQAPKASFADYQLRCVRSGNQRPVDPWKIAASPAALDFATFYTNTQPSRTLSVSNSGSGNLQIAAIAPPAAPFVITADNCSGQTLTAGASCSVTIRLDSAIAGTYSAEIVIPSNDTTNPAVTVVLTGTAQVLPAPQISNLTISAIGSNSALLSWSTDQPATSSVQYGETSGYGYSNTATPLTTQHAITLSGLKAATVYHCRAASTNASGDSTYSADSSFITRIAPEPGKIPADNYLSLQEAYNNSVHNDTIMALSRTYSEDIQLNRPIAVTLQGGYTSSAYATRSGATVINGALTIADGAVTIDNLTITGSDPNSQLTISNVTASGATISWTTNLLANSRIDYGATTAYGSTITEPGQGTSHSITLTGLTPGNTYHYKVSSSTPTGVNGESTDYSFIAPASLEAVITSPAQGAIVAGPDVAVSGTFTNPTGAATSVTVNGLSATVNGSSFVINQLPLQAGINTIFVTVTDINGLTTTASSSVTATSGYTLSTVPGMTIGILSPADGATITGPDSAVKGVIINAKGDETGVVVNGVLANVSGNTFTANHVPLQDGSNSVTATATDITGQTASATRTVTAQQGNYIRLIPNIESGTAPLDITFRIEGSFTFNETSLLYPHNPAIEPIDTANPEDYGYRITAEGTYEFTAEVIGPDGQIYTDTVTVMVVSKPQLDSLLRNKWEGMKTALSVENIDAALADFSLDSKEKYSTAFTRLQGQLPVITANMQSIELIYVKEAIAKYRIKREQILNGQPAIISYYLYFGKSRDGIWRIEQF